MADEIGNLPRLSHIGILVRDVEEAVKNNSARFGLGGIDSQVKVQIENALYRNERVSFEVEYSFIKLDNTEIELVQQLDDHPSPYRDALAEQGEVMHHIAFMVDSIDRHLEMARQAGGSLSILFDAQIPPGRGRFVYVEGLLQGCLMELIELNRN